jgi:hypothetical protein
MILATLMIYPCHKSRVKVVTVKHTIQVYYPLSQIDPLLFVGFCMYWQKGWLLLKMWYRCSYQNVMVSDHCRCTVSGKFKLLRVQSSQLLRVHEWLDYVQSHLYKLNGNRLPCRCPNPWKRTLSTSTLATCCQTLDTAYNRLLSLESDTSYTLWFVCQCMYDSGNVLPCYSVCVYEPVPSLQLDTRPGFFGHLIWRLKQVEKEFTDYGHTASIYCPGPTSPVALDGADLDVPVPKTTVASPSASPWKLLYSPSSGTGSDIGDVLLDDTNVLSPQTITRRFFTRRRLCKRRRLQAG